MKFLTKRGKSTIQVIVGEKQVPSTMNPTVMETRPDYVFCHFDPIYETDDPIIIDALKKHPHFNLTFVCLDKEDEDLDIKAAHQIDPRAREYVETLEKAKKFGIKVDPQIPLAEVQAQIAAAEKAMPLEEEKEDEPTHSIDQFIKEACKRTPGAAVPFRKVYQAYKKWCSKKGYKPMFHLQLSSHLKKLSLIDIAKDPKTKKSVVTGLELIDEE